MPPFLRISTPRMNRITRTASSAAFRLRAAVSDESEALTAVARQAKAHWLYPRADLQRWHKELSISAQQIEQHTVVVAQTHENLIAGWYELLDVPRPWRRCTLEALWVRPAFIGQGVGRALLTNALQAAAACGASTLAIDAEPNAEPFYLHLGAVRVGTVAAPISTDAHRVRPQLLLPLPTRVRTRETRPGC